MLYYKNVRKKHEKKSCNMIYKTFELQSLASKFNDLFLALYCDSSLHETKAYEVNVLMAFKKNGFSFLNKKVDSDLIYQVFDFAKNHPSKKVSKTYLNYSQSLIQMLFKPESVTDLEEISEIETLKTKRTLEASIKLLYSLCLEPTYTKVFVYFLLDENNSCVKIGYSSNPQGRCNTFNAGRLTSLKLLKTIPGTRREEFILHKRFKH